MELPEVICKLMALQQQDTVVFSPSLTSSMISNQKMCCGAACCILQHRAVKHITKIIYEHDSIGALLLTVAAAAFACLLAT